VAGFFKGEYGIGDSSRAYLKVIRESHLPAVFINIHSRNHRNLDRSFDCFSRANPYSVNLMTFSFDHARRFSRDQGKRYFKHRYNIGLWYWELEHLPPRWHHCFEYYDEIWVNTGFCQNSLAEVAPIPVTRITYPFFPGEAPAPDREGFGLDSDAFVFLFNFDFHSVVARKNPEGLIAAFEKAFGGRRENALLILKSINARHYPALAAELERTTANLNVKWINEHLDGPRMRQLFATADCYVSLHRSEGLGLGMARAMSFGKPVIATGYSGNLDFTTPETSLLVRYRLAALERDHGVYEKGNVWAEPDTDHAAEHMRWVFENPAEAASLGRLGQTRLQETINPSTSLEQMSRRLGDIDVRFKSL
jgi:glycosyltransferase involved in cell wall biosynthesis